MCLFFSFLAGFHSSNSYSLGEEEEVESEVQEDFLSFDADLVAEQLTYMDAVSGGKWHGNGRKRFTRGDILFLLHHLANVLVFFGGASGAV